MQITSSTQPDFLAPSFAGAVATLLRDALAVIDRDQDTARRFIARARSLVQGEDGASSPVAPPRGGLAPWQARRVESQIEAQLVETLRIEDFARAVRLSPSYFSRAFKATFGTTFSQYVIRRRIERARTLMLTTRDPIAQIALDCGLADQSHFTRLFHRVVGAPPHAWRRQHSMDTAEAA